MLSFFSFSSLWFSYFLHSQVLLSTYSTMEAGSSATKEHFDKAKVLCGDFLTGNWSKTDAIETSLLSGGYVNYLILCSLPEALRDNKSEPHQVIVRIFTGLNDMALAGEAGEALLFDTVGKAELGPKLLGVFEGGRLEEFINGRTLNFKDQRDIPALISVARKLARYHSLDLPLRKNPTFYEDRLYDCLKKGTDAKKILDLSKQPEHLREMVKSVAERDSVQELTWIIEGLKKLPGRIVCSHNDFYTNNILVKGDRATDEIQEEDVLIADLEMTYHYYRGFDIGLFLSEASFDYSDLGGIKQVGRLSEELQRTFIRAYLEKWKELNPDKFDNAIDNEDSIMKEQMLFGLVLPVLITAWILNHAVKKQAEDGIFIHVTERRAWDLERKAQVKELLNL